MDEIRTDDLVVLLKVFVAFVEYSLDGAIDPKTGKRFIPGVSDLELTPDGTVKLSHVRAVIASAKAEGRS